MNASTKSSGKPSGDQPTPSALDERVRFSLTGHSRTFDPARQAIRPDLADVAEAEHHFAPHYAEPADWHALADAILRDAAASDAGERGRLPVGARFALLDLTGGWAWGYAVDGHVVGYVEADLVAPVANTESVASTESSASA